MEEENRKILEFSQQQEAREDERMAVKKERGEAMAVMQDKLAKEIERKRAQAEEMERYGILCSSCFYEGTFCVFV